MIVSKVRFIPLMAVMRQDRLELSATNTPILVRKTVWKEGTRKSYVMVD